MAREMWNRRKAIRMWESLDITFRALGDELNGDPGAASSWPVYNDGDYILCGKEGHGCEAEDSVILIPFLKGSPWPPYTVQELLDAIEDHIEQQRLRAEEVEED